MRCSKSDVLVLFQTFRKSGATKDSEGRRIIVTLKPSLALTLFQLLRNLLKSEDIGLT